MIRRPWVLSAAALVVLAGCGGPTTVDTASIEKDIASAVGGGPVRVECPQDPVAKAGKKYACTFTLDDDSEGEVTITVRSEDGAGRWEVSRPASGQVEQEVRTDYAKQSGRKVKRLDCPDTLKQGENTCTMELRDGAQREVKVMVKGGDFEWETR